MCWGTPTGHEPLEQFFGKVLEGRCQVAERKLFLLHMALFVLTDTNGRKTGSSSQNFAITGPNLSSAFLLSY